MSSTTHQIVLTARDQTQQAFSAIERGAKQDAAALQQMGQQGSAAFKQTEQGATQAASGLDRFSKAGAALGAVFTTGASLLGEWNRSAQDAAAIQRQLEAAVAATGESFDTYASAVAAVGARAVQLGQDDEAASQAIAALTEITGSASVALNEMGLVFDLAAAKGIGLTSAAELIGKVYEGNTGILQRYGIVVAQGATAEEALGQIQQQVAGQAEAHATTYARLREEFSNLTDSIGATVGGFAPFVQMLPGLTSGVTLVGGAIGALIPEMEEAGLAATALDLALGPVGLVLAAGAAAGALFMLTRDADTYSTVASRAAETSRSFEEELSKLRSTGSASADDFSKVNDAWKQMLADQVALSDAIAANEKQQGGFTKATADALDATQIKKINDALLALFDNANVSAAAVTAEFLKLQQQFNDGTISADEFTKAVQAMNDMWYRFTGATDSATKALYDAALAAGDGGKSLDDLFQAAQNAQVGVDDLADAQQRLLEQTAPLVVANTENAFSLKTVFDNSLKTADAIKADADAKQAALVQTAELTAANTENAHSLYGVWQQAQETSAAMTDNAAAAEKQREAIVESMLAQRAAAVDAAALARENESAFSKIERGSTSAAVAFRAFADAQDNLLKQESVFSAQASEYSQQVNAMTAAHDILAQRQAEGVTLTKEQTQFMDKYDEALGRAQGGVEDATIAEGILAEQYSLNMEKGDQMRDSLDGVNKTSGDLTKAIRDLIESLDGLPPEKHTDVSTPGATEAKDQVDNLHGSLADLPGVTSPAVEMVGVQAALDGIGSVSGALAALDGQTAFTNIVNTTRNTVINEVINSGATAGQVTGGMVSGLGGVMVRVNEGGRETATLPTGDNVWLPSGSVVWPHAASVEGNRGKGGGRPFYNYGSIHIHANNPTEFFDQLNGYELAGR